MRVSKRSFGALSLTTLAVVMFGCAGTNTTVSPSDSLSWLTGCWQLDDLSVEETWTKSLHGDQLFGFSVNTKDAKRVFFEQLRIDLEPARAMLYAYPRGVGPTAFEGLLDGTPRVEFINENNDYPQRIVYQRVGNRLAAEISLKDNSKLVSWDYGRCK